MDLQAVGGLCFSSLCPQLLTLASVPVPVQAAQGASLLPPPEAPRTWVFPPVSFAALTGPCAVCVLAGFCTGPAAPADEAASASHPETGRVVAELAYSRDTHTPSLSLASVTAPHSEF